MSLISSRPISFSSLVLLGVVIVLCCIWVKGGAYYQQPPARHQNIELSRWDGPLPFSERWSAIRHEFDWLWFFAIGAIAIKSLLLRQTPAEIVACLADAMGFLLSHTVQVVRFVARELHHLAAELRGTELDRKP
jgi:hypothetical protein